jgi:hypothetical protein
MSETYRKINYALRPAKTIERKMLCEAFERLHSFQKVELYRYIGFGSIYFSDFLLFHRGLGIVDLLSIERDDFARECFEFNKPYACIGIDFRASSDVLPGLDWTKRSIVWLDYDGKLDLSVIGDVATVTSRASSGTVFLVSVNVQADREPSLEGRELFKRETGEAFEIDAYRLRECKRLVGDKLPAEITGRDLRQEGLAQVARRVITNEIQEQISVRNAMLPPEHRLAYQQFFNFIYRDGALMLTVGGILYQADEHEQMAECGFNTLDFVRMGQDPFRIEIPCLTAKEIRALNEQLPTGDVATIQAPGVPVEDVANYAKIYRYFPAFGEVQFT